MKAIIYLLAGALLVSFTSKKVDTVDGIWTGVYRTDMSREKVLVKFEAGNVVELYNGDVEESNKHLGTYELKGDSVLKFTYTNAEGKECSVEGTINKKKNYVDGVWQTSESSKGSFYLKKEKLQELYIQP